MLIFSRAKMKKWFEKWAVEKAKRKEKGLPAVVDYRDPNFVSDDGSDCMIVADEAVVIFGMPICCILYCMH